MTRALLRGSRTPCVLPPADYRLPADFALPTDMPCTSHTGNLPVLRRIHLHRIFRPCPRFPRQRTALPPMCRFRSLRLTRCRFANPPPASRRDARKFHRIGRPAAQISPCRTSPPDFSRTRPVHKTASPLAPPPFSPENGIFFCAPLFPVCRVSRLQQLLDRPFRFLPCPPPLHHFALKNVSRETLLDSLRDFVSRETFL